MSLVASIQKRDPAAPTFLEVLLGYPGFHALTLFHPLAAALWKIELRGLSRFWANIGRMVTGIEIHPAAPIGKNLFIDHGQGVVIGQTAVIDMTAKLFLENWRGWAKGKKRHIGRRTRA